MATREEIELVYRGNPPSALHMPPPDKVVDLLVDIQASASATASIRTSFSTIFKLQDDAALTYSNVTVGDVIRVAGYPDFEVLDSGATSFAIQTAGGVKVGIIDGAMRPPAPNKRPMISGRSQGLEYAADLSRMTGYAAEASVTGGNGVGSVYYITNGADDINVEGSPRWAIAQASGGGTVVVEADNFIDCHLKAPLQFPDNFTFCDAAGKLTFTKPFGVIGILIGDNNVVKGLAMTARRADGVSGDDDLVYINPETVTKFYFEHCEFGESDDGAVDIYYVGTITNTCRGTMYATRFNGCNKCMLVGSEGATNEDTQVYLTMIDTFYDHCGQRQPIVANQAFVHSFDGHHSGQQLYDELNPGQFSGVEGIKVRDGGYARVENCMFELMDLDDPTPGDQAYSAVFVEAGGRANEVDSYAFNGREINEQSAPGVPVPAYTLVSRNAAGPTRAHQLESRRQIDGIAGRGSRSQAAGPYVWHAASTERPNGRNIRGEGGHLAAGRWKAVPAAYDVRAEYQPPIGDVVLTIADEAFAEFDARTDRGMFALISGTSGSPQHPKSSIIYYDVGSSVTFLSVVSGVAADLDVDNTVLTVAAAVDGNVTVCLGTSNKIRVINRAGLEYSFRISWMG